jgi:RimJ/RimL family protein N-acetyltransferase
MAAYRKTEIVPLQTERLVLRPVALSDVPRIQLLFPHLNVLRYMNAAIPWPYPADGAQDAVQKFLAKMETQEEYYWAITRKGEGELMGVIALTPASDEDHRGFWIGEAYWGRGYMREATAAVNDFAFDVLQMEELLLGNAEPNVASHRLKESAGAEIVSIGEEDYVGGRFREVRWRLTAEAWKATRKPSI